MSNPDVFIPMLERLAKRQIINTIIDVGASDGRWSKMARLVWPNANLLMIEANIAHVPGMIKNFPYSPREKIVWGLAGQRLGCERVKFNKEDPFQGADPSEDGEWLPIVTIEQEISLTDFKPPYLIKLDCHGREYDILESVGTFMPSVAAVVAEVYTVSLGPRSMSFIPLASHMRESYLLTPTDLCDPMVRPFDGRLSQIDVLFEKTTAPGMDIGGYK